MELKFGEIGWVNSLLSKRILIQVTISQSSLLMTTMTGAGERFLLEEPKIFLAFSPNLAKPRILADGIQYEYK